MSPDLLGAIGELTAFADDYRTLEQLTGTLPFRQFPPEVSVPQRVQIAAFAEDVAIRERSRLHLGDQPVYELRSLVEQSGVHVCYGGLPSRLAGLYAFVPDLGYCILINRKHPPERRRWTLAHEYAHFLADRHKPGVDTVQVPKRKPLSERFADAFAASFLMPETAMRRHFLAVTERTSDFQTADLSRLAHHFGRTAHSLKQDVLAKVLTRKLTAILVWVAQWMTKRLYRERRRDYQVNFANALSKMKENVVRLLGLAPPPDLLERVVCAMALEVEAIRPDLRALRAVPWRR